MRHDQTNNPHHVITLKVGDRIKARHFTGELRMGELYEVTGFRDLAFPEDHLSTTQLHSVTRDKPISVSTLTMQFGFSRGDWVLS